jgi:hypothetical protein
MLTPLAVAAAVTLAPAQPGSLQLTNVRFTQGELGPARKDARVLPGDVVFIGYDIDGLTIDPDGKTRYTMGMEVTDATGKLIFRQDPRELADVVPLRGGKMPARAFITVGLDQPAGAYNCKITVTDLKGPGDKPEAKPKSSLAVKFEVGKPEFGIVQVYTSHDAGGALVAPTTGVVGQSIYVIHGVASFARDPKTKQPDVLVEYQILDEKGQPTLAKPIAHVQDAKSERPVDEKDGAFKLDFPLFLNRPGKFTVRITATDRVSNKKATAELPITALPAN